MKPNRLVICAVLSLAACQTHGSEDAVENRTHHPILLFAGSGTSRNDVAAVEDILRNNHLDYWTADSSQLNQMTESQMSRYRLVIMPGGNFVHMGDGLTAAAAANVRNRVKSGLNYLGLCAGSFLAGSFPRPY